MREHDNVNAKETTVFFRLDPVLAGYLDVIAEALGDDDSAEHGHDADVEAASTALAVGVHEMLRRIGLSRHAEKLRQYMLSQDPGASLVWGVAIDRHRERGDG